MPQSSSTQSQQFRDAYIKLQTLIETRKKFEREHDHRPYNLYPTTINFQDIDGNSLFYYAAGSGDLEKVKACFHDPEIDKKNESNLKAISIALANGHLAVVEYLYHQGLAFTNIDLAICGTEEVYRWFYEKIKHALYESFPPGSKDIKLPNIENQIFKKESNTLLLGEDFTHLALKRAVEIGDIEFLQRHHIDEHHYNRLQLLDGNIQESLLITAIKNGQLDTVKFLLANNADINTHSLYKETPLIAAIKSGHQEVIVYLLTQYPNIHKEDELKQTALHYAVSKGDRISLHTLIKAGANIDHANSNGNTILHLAVVNQPSLVAELIELPGVRILVNVKNIYGKTPVDLAIENGESTLLKILTPMIAQDVHEKNPSYGVKSTNISQNNVLKKLRYYLKTQYRDSSFFYSGGFCNGFSFLKSLYAAAGKEKYYFDTLAIIASWDGEDSSLHQTFKDIPQADFYKSRAALFEQWLNDIIWFQSSTYANVIRLNQEDRLAQYEIVGKNQDYQYACIYSEESNCYHQYMQIITYERTYKQLEEIFTYFMRMPARTYFEIGGGSHATSGYIDDKKNFVYYDPNFQFETEKSADWRKSLERMINYKYILLNKFSDELTCKFDIFYFHKDKSLLQLDNFVVLRPEEYPDSPAAALAFQKKSANQFTPLHIAVMTNSIVSLKILLSDGYCNIDAKDILGRDVLTIACDNNFCEAVKLILPISKISQDDINRLTISAYKRNNHDVLSAIFAWNNKTLLMALFIEAIEKNDMGLIKKLIDNKMADVNQIFEKQLPLIVAIDKKNIEMVKCLIANGAELFNIYDAHQITPLEHILDLSNLEYIQEIISSLSDINQLDASGFAAIHHAARYCNKDVIKLLIMQGADVNVRTQSGDSILEIIGKKLPFFSDQDELLTSSDCIALLLPHYNLDLSQANDRELIKRLLADYAHGSDDLYTMIVNKCSKEFLNQQLFNGLHLINYLLTKIQASKIEILLEKGVYVDSQFESGNTCLMGLLKHTNYPDRHSLIDLFLSYQTDVGIKNRDGKTAIDLVSESTDEAIKQIFIEHGLLPNPRLRLI